MSRLSRDDWAQAALWAIAGGGVSAVAIEPLAAGLGATKGSFYWHFSSRDELVAAALELWEQRGTRDVIAGLECSGETARSRLRTLFFHVFDAGPHGAADVALLSHADDPVVRESLQRVADLRISYVATLLRECGLPARTARRRAVFAYSAFLGHAQLRHSAPELLKRSIGSFPRYADEVLDTLLLGAGAWPGGGTKSIRSEPFGQ